MNISRVTQKYIRAHPSIADCLDRGLINYSALARKICDETEIEAFDAVLIACRRYFAKKKERVPHEKKILSLVRGAKIKVSNKIAVAIIEKGKSIDKIFELQKLIKSQKGDFNLIEGEGAVTIITNIEFIPEIRARFPKGIKKISKNLVLISMVFNKEIENTSGVVSYIYRLFAENNINVREEMSCWTDLLVVIEKENLAPAMQVLEIA